MAWNSEQTYFFFFRPDGTSKSKPPMGLMGPSLATSSVGCLLAGDLFPEPFEFDLVVKVDCDPAPAAGRLFDIDFRAEGDPEFIFQGRHVGCTRSRDPAPLAIRPDEAEWFRIEFPDSLLDGFFGRSDGEAFLPDPFGHRDLLAGVSQWEEGPGMACRECAGTDHVLDRIGQFEEADQVGDCGAINIDPLAQFFLGAAEFFEVPGKRCRFFEGVQVFPLNVFDDRQFGHLAVIGVSDLDGNPVPAGFRRGTQASFPHDELEPIAIPPNH